MQSILRTLRLHLSQQNNTLRSDGLNPSIRKGIDCIVSDLENKMTSLFTNLQRKPLGESLIYFQGKRNLGRACHQWYDLH